MRLCLSRVKAHSSSGVGKRYHELLQRIYYTIQYYHSSVPAQYLLKVAVEAMNTTMGGNDLFPSSLILEIISKISMLCTGLLSQKILCKHQNLQEPIEI